MPSTSRDIQPYKPSNCLKRCPKDIFARFKNTQLQFQTLIIKEILRQTGKAQFFSHDFSKSADSKIFQVSMSLV